VASAVLVLLVTALGGPVLVISVPALANGLIGPVTHVDGDGPLGSYGVVTSDAISVDPSIGAPSWSFGVALCHNSGVSKPVVKSVEPTTTIGTGFALAGMGIRRFERSNDNPPIMSTHPWPPPRSQVRQDLHEVSGFRVVSACTDAPVDDYTELFIGLSRVGTDGGGWEGLAVHYTVDGRDYILLIDHGMGICGDSLSCEIPGD
jgi:hypothetical protein